MDDLRTVVTEMGLAFDGTGEDLGQIIDTSNSFIETANANFDTTTKLIKDSNRAGFFLRLWELLTYAYENSLTVRGRGYRYHP